MSSHYRLKQCKLMPSTSVSSTTVYTSSVLVAHMLDNIGIQCNATGTMAGTFSIQVSNDYEQDALGNVLQAGNWIEVLAPTASGSTTQIYNDFNQLSAPYLRVVYTNASGSGTVQIWASGKGLN